MEGRRVFQPELTGLRAIATTIIVFGHLLQRVDRFHDGGAPISALDNAIFTLFATPFSGCCIFFCISGYSLFSSLQAHQSGGGPSFVGPYVLRRLLRLCPPYFTVLIATYIFLTATGYSPIGTNMFNVQPASLTTSLLASLTLSHDTLYGTFPRLFPPGWFIETQFQFYAVAPLFVALYLRIPSPKLRVRIGYMLLLVFAAIAILVSYGPREMQYSLIAFLPYFWAGTLLADMRRRGDGDRLGQFVRRWPSMGWLALAVFVLLGPPVRYDALQLVGRLVCLAIMFRVAFLADGSLHRVLGTRYLAPVGIGCYSIFLVHLQILQVLTPAIFSVAPAWPLPIVAILCFAAEVPVILVAATLFYHLVERPSLTYAHWVSKRWFADRPVVGVTTAEGSARH